MNEVSALVCAAYFAKWIISGLRLPLRWVYLDACFGLFLIWFGGVVVVNAAIGTASIVTKSHAASWLQMLAAYLVMRHVAIDALRIPSLWLAGLFSIAVLGVVASNVAGLALVLAGNGGTESATYQGLARAFLLTSAIGLLTARTIWQRSLFYVPVVAVLFLLGARSELLGAVILFLVFELLLAENKVAAMSSLIGTACVSILVFYFFFDSILDTFPESRFLALLIQGVDDGSVVERIQQQTMAWEMVANSPITGSYGYYQAAASVGSYAHSWLSVWADLGLFGLILFFALYSAAASAAVRVLIISSASSDGVAYRTAALAFALLIMFIVFAIAAKGFTDTGLATVIGILASMGERCRSHALTCGDKPTVARGQNSRDGEGRFPILTDRSLS